MKIEISTTCNSFLHNLTTFSLIGRYEKTSKVWKNTQDKPYFVDLKIIVIFSIITYVALYNTMIDYRIFHHTYIIFGQKRYKILREL